MNLSVRSSALLACILSAACFTSMHAQDWAKTKLDASPRHGEYVTITEASGRKLQAWVVYPEVKGKAPVVVMIHEIFGLSDWARLMADEVAAKGYIVVEPDMLSGYGPPPKADAMAMPAGAPPMDHMHPATPSATSGAASGAATVPASPGGTPAFPDQSSITRAVSGLDRAGVMADLNAAADYGKKLPAASGRLAVAGFCWGGGNSFAFATQRPDLSAAFVFYGPPPPAADMAKVTAPIYGFYGEKDARIGATIPQATADMKSAGKKYEPVTYAGAGHGFMRAGQDPAGKPEDKEAFDEGFERMLRELKKIK